MIRVGILGYSGRMGQLIAEEIAATDGCALAGGAVRELRADYKKPEGALITPHADELIAVSDAVIDFASAETTAAFVHSAATHKKPYLCGVTGLGVGSQQALKNASAKIPVLYAANTSLSLAAAKQAAALVAKLLSHFDYDVTISDEHHRMKKDAPSGTAKALGEAVRAASGGAKAPAYTSVRAGNIVGEHDVIFAGNGEVIRVRHSVTDRRVFARGAVQAALWLHRQPPGFYSMDDVLGIKP